MGLPAPANPGLDAPAAALLGTGPFAQQQLQLAAPGSSGGGNTSSTARLLSQAASAPAALGAGAAPAAAHMQRHQQSSGSLYSRSHISAQHPAGGPAGTPFSFRSLADALAAARDGDTITLLPGTHNVSQQGLLVKQRVLIRARSGLGSAVLDHKANVPLLRITRCVGAAGSKKPRPSA